MKGIERRTGYYEIIHNYTMHPPLGSTYIPADHSAGRMFVLC